MNISNKLKKIWYIGEKGISLQPLSTGGITGNGRVSVEKVGKGAEKKFKKHQVIFGILEKTITFAAAKNGRVHRQEWE